MIMAHGPGPVGDPILADLWRVLQSIWKEKYANVKWAFSSEESRDGFLEPARTELNNSRCLIHCLLQSDHSVEVWVTESFYTLWRKLDSTSVRFKYDQNNKVKALPSPKVVSSFGLLRSIMANSHAV